MQKIRIFISSPKDVAQERERARQVVQGLQRRYAQHFELESVFWEDMPLSLDSSFQQGIDVVLSRERGIDIAIFILWSRLGSPVGPRVLRDDGREYRSGTEREFDLMLQARRAQNSQRPEMLAYYRVDNAAFEERLRGTTLRDKEDLIQQKKLVEQFMREEFHDAQTGTNVRAYHSYQQPQNFAQRLRVHLQEILDRWCADQQSKPIWDTTIKGSPFQGLAAFSYDHADVFFGREDEVSEARIRLSEAARGGTAFLLIGGASGTGKSSLAAAGLLPEVVAHETDDIVSRWLHAVCTPADLKGRPAAEFAALLFRWVPGLADRTNIEDFADSLSSDAGVSVKLALIPALKAESRSGEGAVRLIVLVDQLEELFTDARLSLEKREEFARILAALAASGYAWVVATIRSDYYPALLNEPALVSMKSHGRQLDLTPPRVDAVRRLIEAPALLAGLTYERRDDMSLADQILRDASEKAELLPLLEDLLRELYEHRDSQGTLTFAAYNTLGGIDGAIARRADEILQSQAPAVQKTFPDVLRALVSIGDGADIRAVRQRVSLASFPEGSPGRALIDALIEGRLATATMDAQGVPEVTIAHEAVLRVWPRAVAWIAENAEFLRARDRLTARMREGGSLTASDPLLPTARKMIAEQRALIDNRLAAYIEQQLAAIRRGRALLAAAGVVLLMALIGVWFVLASQRRSEFARSLDSVNPGQLKEKLQEADEFGAALDPLLRLQVQRADKVDATAAERRAALPSRLVLVSRDQTQVPVLSEVLLSGELPYVAPIRERLRLYADELRPQWLGVLRNEQQPSARRFRAALGLAGLDGNADVVEWTTEDTKFIAEQLSQSYGQDQLQLRELLRPISEQLIPDLDMLFDAEGSTAEQQENVTLALADYAGADGERMARLLTRANQRQTEILYPKVAEFKSGPVRDGLLALTREQPDEKLGQLERVRLGRRRANAAIALLRQGERDLYFDALRITDDPESLSQFVSRCKNWGVTAEELVQSMGRSRVLRASATGDARRVEARVMYGLLLALGSYSLEQIAEADRERRIADLKQLYVEDPSAAVHSASGWLLRTWGRETEVLRLDEVEVPYDASGVREWFRLRVTVKPKTSGLFGLLGTKGKPQTFSLTFVVFPAEEYRLGSPEYERGELERDTDETPHTVKLSRPFALCDREVTWGLYDVFDGGNWRKRVSGEFKRELGPNDVVFVEDWYGWMRFCRWLTSEYRGDDESWQCYRDPGELEKDDNGDPRVVDRLLVERGGFRMPTEAEWEVGGRAGQRTAWTFGSDVSLLGDYGWFMENSGKRPQSAASKPPGLGGLHDVQGNLFEWVHDRFSDIEGNSVVVDPQGMAVGQNRVLRGGGWYDDAADCRLAYRIGYGPTTHSASLGFRLALSPSVTSPEAKEAEANPQARN